MCFTMAPILCSSHPLAEGEDQHRTQARTLSTFNLAGGQHQTTEPRQASTPSASHAASQMSQIKFPPRKRTNLQHLLPSQTEPDTHLKLNYSKFRSKSRKFRWKNRNRIGEDLASPTSKRLDKSTELPVSKPDNSSSESLKSKRIQGIMAWLGESGEIWTFQIQTHKEPNLWIRSFTHPGGATEPQMRTFKLSSLSSETRPCSTRNSISRLGRTPRRRLIREVESIQNGLQATNDRCEVHSKWRLSTTIIWILT